MHRLAAGFICLFFFVASFAQQFAGPMLGPVSHRTASVWVGADRQTDASIVVEVWLSGAKPAKPMQAILRANTVARGQTVFYPSWHYEIVGLEPGSTYQYEVRQLKPSALKLGGGSFTTQTLFQWRTPAPDFSFIAGSCAYFNEPAYDRPGPAYGTENGIFETMANERQAAFMLWLGDNWYTRDVDYTNEWGLWYRAFKDRSQPVLKSLLSAMPHIAIWDDHDYGPNDYGASYTLKSTSREVFRQFWRNPTYGQEEEGIYTRYQYNDIDLFMLDDRWWRSFDDLPDSINGRPNANKHMLGRRQLDWLKQELLYSKINPFISFRFIVIGSQVMNPGSPYDKLKDFPAEYNELLNFIRYEKIPGVIFLNGDRHHSEVLKVEEEGMYPLYEITCSPLTSGTHKFSGTEANNKWRIVGVDQKHNYGHFSIAGSRGNRQLTVIFKGADGKPLADWSINQKELSWK